MICHIPCLLLYFLKKKVISATMTRNITRTTATASIDLFEELVVDNAGGVGCSVDRAIVERALW